MIFYVYFYAGIGGTFYGIFATFLKYYANIYGSNLEISLVLGYVGFYSIISVPLVLCLICIYNIQSDIQQPDHEIFSQGNSKSVYIIIFLLSIARFFFSINCIISLSPLLFSFGLFLSVLLNLTVHVALGRINGNWMFYSAFVFVVLAVICAVLVKVLKHSGKNKLKYRIKKLSVDELKRKNKAK